MEGVCIEHLIVVSSFLPLLYGAEQRCNIFCPDDADTCPYRSGCHIRHNFTTFQCAGPTCNLLLKTNFTRVLDTADNVIKVLDELEVELQYPFKNNQTKLGNLRYNFIAANDTRNIYLKRYFFVFIIENAASENSGDYSVRVIDGYNSLEIFHKNYSARIVDLFKCKSEVLQTVANVSFLLTCSIKTNSPDVKVNILSHSQCLLLESESSTSSMHLVKAFVRHCNDMSNFTCVAESKTFVSSDDHYKEKCKFNVTASDNAISNEVPPVIQVSPDFFTMFNDPRVTFAIVCYLGVCSILYLSVNCCKKCKIKRVYSLHNEGKERTFDNIAMGNEGTERIQGAVGYQELITDENKTYVERIYDGAS